MGRCEVAKRKRVKKCNIMNKIHKNNSNSRVNSLFPVAIKTNIAMANK